ncbi:hypothetical protein GTP38_25170 [Duganella sp. FT94W]|uniref:Formyl transferase N-terminal domain-containing protein n=1 Tax=Duganella lactea TaxID=2692173 RepID=A0ABW9VF09_9BURK|nr:formyltransferase family protein [Duganella lactea]MYM37621.1 hypothetical protein [Duganella lactea]
MTYTKYVTPSQDINVGKSTKVLFFGRSGCSATVTALAHLHLLGFKVTFVESTGRGQLMPESIDAWEGEYIFCFRSLLILPTEILIKAKIAAINFHPGPPEYPGSGCINFALYDNASQYGVTAHLMNEKVDNGRILECIRFAILKNDTVDSLLARTHLKMLDLFYDVVTGIGLNGEDFISSLLKKSHQEAWRGDARRMVELEKLKTIPHDVSEEELIRLIRATYTPRFPPRVMLNGYEFLLGSPVKM